MHLSLFLLEYQLIILVFNYRYQFFIYINYSFLKFILYNRSYIFVQP